MRTLLLLLTIPLALISAAQTGALEGRLTDANGASLFGATIQVVGTDLGTAAGDDGRYRIEGVPAGTQTVTSSYVGYAPVRRTVIIPEGGTATLDLRFTEGAFQTEIVVVGDAFTETDGFRAQQASTATRFPVNVEKLPNTVRVLPQELFTETRATLPQDVTRYVSSVQQLPGFGDNAGFLIRGFFANYEILRNGVRGINPADLYNVERIEVLKGPISSLYGGTGAFAGNVNVITKRPLETFGGEITAFAGSNDFYRIQGDVGGPFSERGNFRYRLNAVAESAGSHRELFESEKYAGAGSVEWAPSERTTVRVDASYLRRTYSFDEGLPLMDGSLPSGLTTFDLPIERTFFGDGAELSREGNASLGVEAEHELADGLSVRVAALHNDYSIDIESSRVGANVGEDGRTGSRVTSEGPQSTRLTTAQADLIYRTERIGAETVFLVGYEHFDNRYEYDASSRDLGTVDLVTGVRTPSANTELTPSFAGFSTYNGNAVYAQVFSQVTERLAVLAGLRQDWQTNDGRFNGQGEAITGDQLSPRFGATYAVTPATRIFANYGQSFAPNFAFDVDGDVFESDRVRQLELGFRQQLFDNRALFTLAAFDIERSNVVIPDPDEFGQSVAAGRQSSQGIEFDFTGQLVTGLETIVTYAYNQTEVTEEDDPNFGQTLAAAPEHSASAFGRYRFSDSGTLREQSPLGGLSLNAGVVYNSDIEATLPNSIVIPAAARVDVGAAYDLDQWRFGVNVNNLLDERLYVTNLFALFPQAPRNFVATVTYRINKPAR